MNQATDPIASLSPLHGPTGPIQGPYRVIGRTIVGAPQQRRDSEGQPIPGSFSEPSVCEVLCMHSDASRTEATVELLRSSWDLLRQKDELAFHLDSAITYIEHTEGNRRVMFDAQSLRQLLARELQEGLRLSVSYGMGRERTTATFDLQAARQALEHVTAAPSHPAASYTQLQDLVHRLALALQASADERLAGNPRDARAGTDNALANEAFRTLDHGGSCGRIAHEPQYSSPSLDIRTDHSKRMGSESGSSLRP